MIDFEAIIKRGEERKQKVIVFNTKKEKYFAHYAERFEIRGYDRRNEFLFKKLTQFCAYYFNGVNNKGLFLCKPEIDPKEKVNTGVGKTWGIEIVGDLFGIKVTTVSKLVDAFNDDRDKMYRALEEPMPMQSEEWKIRYKGDRIIDEVGSEKLGNCYGQKSEVFPDIADARYESFIHEGYFTHFTSNLKPSELAERYGARVWSRLNEMCTIIEVSGIDNRFN